MKFNVAWANVLSQNIVLRFSTLSLSICVIGLLIALTKASLKEPIIIERACYSRALDGGSSDHTEAEILAFFKEAIPQRFDNDTLAQDSFLSNEEIAFREQEQKDLAAKEMKQRVIVNRILKTEGKDIILDSDRLLSVGPVRSAFSFPLKLTIASVKRTNGNPYGLKIIQVKPVQNERKDAK